MTFWKSYEAMIPFQTPASWLTPHPNMEDLVRRVEASKGQGTLRVHHDAYTLGYDPLNS